MRRTLVTAAAVGAALVLAAPAAQASTTKYEFAGVTFPDGQTGKIQASTKTMKKKPDNVYCYYATSDWESLGHYLEFVESAPASAEGVRDFCLAHYDDRWE